MNRFLTPDEVRALSEPAVQRQVKLINESLCTSNRFFSVMVPLYDAVAAGLAATNWVVVPRGVSHGYAMFEVYERVVSESSAEEAGAELLRLSTQFT